MSEDYDVTALDRAIEPLQYVKTKKIRASIDELPFPDKSFDMVISAEVLEHLPYGVYEKALSEIQRVASKYILISVPNDENIRGTLVRCNYCGCVFSAWRHLRSFSHEKMNDLLNNFNIVSIAKCGPANRSYHPLLLNIKLCLGGYPGNLTDVCPQCNKSGNSQKSRTIIRLVFGGLNLVLPPYGKKRRWLVSLYKRIDV